MRAFLLTCAVMVFAAGTSAQQAVAPVAQGTSAAAPSRNEVLTNQLQELLNSKDQQQALQQGIAIASLTGCTSKRAGKPQTDKFYKEMQAVGEQVGALCKAERAPEARALVLQTLKANRYNQVVMAANNCYASGKANFDMMAGEQLANDFENYARWARDPQLAAREMTDRDICQ